MAYSNPISKLSNKPSALGANINLKIKQSKIDEIIDAVNDLLDGTVTISTIPGPLTITSTTDTTSPTTGALIVSGGVGIAKALSVGTNILLGKEVNHTINVITTTTAATAGGNITITSGTGATSGAGGALTLTGGTGGVTAASVGGAITITSGVSGAGTGPSGDVTFRSGNGTGSGVSGNFALGTGTAASANSGTVLLRTGIVTVTGTTGTVGVNSGSNTGTGDTGASSFGTGSATAGTSGAVSLISGAGTTGTGTLTIGSGNASAGNSGAITISTGTASGTAGIITLSTGTNTGWIINASGALVAGTDATYDIGNAASDPRDINLTRDIVFRKALNHSVKITDSVTATVAGGNLSLTAGAGNTTGAGGSVTITAGNSGATAGTAGGNVIITSGTTTSTTVSSIIKTTSTVVKNGTNNASVESGGTITGKQLVDGHITATGGTGNWQLPTAAQIATAIGGTVSVGTNFDFTFNAISMTAGNTATLVVGSNMTAKSAITGGTTLTLTQAADSVAVFRVTFTDAGTNCIISRLV